MANRPRKWARKRLDESIDSVRDALDAHCAKPGSSKRVHAARKRIARLQAFLLDFGPLVDGANHLLDCVHDLHRCAGEVRDADVLLERAEAYRYDALDQERAELDRVLTSLRRHRRNALRELDGAIESTELRA